MNNFSMFPNAALSQFLNITPCLLTDSYKMGHFDMYIDELTNVHSYEESRTGAVYPESVFLGLQVYLKKYFLGKVVTRDGIEFANNFNEQHFFGNSPFNRRMWEYILNKHEGRLPLRIKAVAEGTVLPIGHPSMSVEITDEALGINKGLTNHFETILTHLWHASNVSTISFNIKRKMKEYFDKASDNIDALAFMLHDFGFRGATCVEAAGIGGMGHLLHFKGTDTIPAILYGQYYYNTDEMLGYSVLASEHSIKTQLGELGEMKLVKRLIEKYPNGILSDVQDSYNIEKAIHFIGQNYRKEIMARNGKYVFRPDSPRFKGDTPKDQIVWIANLLGHYFGYTTNYKGYKVLHPSVGIIYGDGLSVQEIFDAIQGLIDAGWAPETCVFGMGGGLLQKHNRDTQRHAFKCSAQRHNSIWYDIAKNPLDASKASKKGKVESFLNREGKLVVGIEGDDAYNHTAEDMGKGYTPLFHTIFENGELIKEWSFGDLRKQAEIVYTK